MLYISIVVLVTHTQTHTYLKALLFVSIIHIFNCYY